MKFQNATYAVNEDDGIVQPLLVLSNPSSFVETVQVITTDVTTNGKVAELCFSFTVMLQEVLIIILDHMMLHFLSDPLMLHLISQ